MQADQAKLIPQRLASNPGSGTSKPLIRRGFPRSGGRAPQALVGAGADRRGVEDLGGGAAEEEEVRAVTSCSRLVRLSSRRTTKAIGTARRPAPVFTSTGPLTGSHERSTRITPAWKSTLITAGHAQLATAQAAEERHRPEGLLAIRRGGEQLVRHLGRLDPVPPATDRGKVEVLGRIDGYLVAADRPAEDDAQRIENVRDGRGGQALRAEVVDEVLDVTALVAADRRGLVRLAAAVEDRAIVGAGN